VLIKYSSCSMRCAVLGLPGLLGARPGSQGFRCRFSGLPLFLFRDTLFTALSPILPKGVRLSEGDVEVADLLKNTLRSGGSGPVKASWNRGGRTLSEEASASN